MIYYITNGDAIKIGYTKHNDVMKRLKQLQTSSPDKLYLLGYDFGDLKKEKELHIKFANYRIRSNGEWFRGDSSILEYINGHNLLQNTIVDIIDNKIIPLFSIKRIEVNNDG